MRKNPLNALIFLIVWAVTASAPPALAQSKEAEVLDHPQDATPEIIDRNYTVHGTDRVDAGGKTYEIHKFDKEGYLMRIDEVDRKGQLSRRTDRVRPTESLKTKSVVSEYNQTGERIRLINYSGNMAVSEEVYEPVNGRLTQRISYDGNYPADEFSFKHVETLNDHGDVTHREEFNRLGGLVRDHSEYIDYTYRPNGEQATETHFNTGNQKLSSVEHTEDHYRIETTFDRESGRPIEQLRMPDYGNGQIQESLYGYSDETKFDPMTGVKQSYSEFWKRAKDGITLAWSDNDFDYFSKVEHFDSNGRKIETLENSGGDVTRTKFVKTNYTKYDPETGQALLRYWTDAVSSVLREIEKYDPSDGTWKPGTEQDVAALEESASAPSPVPSAEPTPPVEPAVKVPVQPETAQSTPSEEATPQPDPNQGLTGIERVFHVPEISGCGKTAGDTLIRMADEFTPVINELRKQLRAIQQDKTMDIDEKIKKQNTLLDKITKLVNQRTNIVAMATCTRLCNCKQNLSQFLSTHRTWLQEQGYRVAR